MYKPKYFKDVEFARCNPPCELSDMDEGFMKLLDCARAKAKVAFVLNSAYRTKEHEISRKRSGSSSHCKGLAADIACSSSFVRYRIVSSLIEVGFRRIGIYPTFIHVDSDEEKISAIWLDSSFVSSDF